MSRTIVCKTLFFIVFIVIFTSGCSKKMVISTYNDISVPVANIANVNTTIEGSSQFIDNINSFLPSEFNGKEILINDPTSPYILHIIENYLQTASRSYETQEEKTIQYVDYVFDPQQNKAIPIIRTRDIIYFQKCLVTDYSLSASVTTRFKRETIFATVQDEQCLKRRFNLFNNYEPHSRNSGHFYNTLVEKLTSNIKNYLVPYTTTYSVDIDDDFDVPMSDIDEENYENIIEMLADGIYSNKILIQLVKLNNNYPNSYSINYNLGLLYEYIGQNKNALFYYKKCLDIKTTKEIINRIQTINRNMVNKKNAQL